MINQSREMRLARIKKSIQKKVRGTTERPRLTVYRSLKHFYAQLVDDSTSKTIASVSTLSKDLKAQHQSAKDRKAMAKEVGKAVAAKAKEKNIRRVVFDRNGYQYHGLVKAIADGAREAGLEF